MLNRILLAEASPSTQRAVEMALPGSEFELKTVADGLDAIRAIAESVPEAVLVGLSLPGKDGYEVGAFLRSQPHYRQTALVFLRGAFEPLDPRKLSRIDHEGVIERPFDGEALLTALRAALERKRELPSLPEEPVFEAASPPVDSIPETASLPDWTDDIEQKVRAVVRQEVLRNQAEMEDRARDIVSAEFRKVLVEELKSLDRKR